MRGSGGCTGTVAASETTVRATCSRVRRRLPERGYLRIGSERAPDPKGAAYILVCGRSGGSTYSSLDVITRRRKQKGPAAMTAQYIEGEGKAPSHVHAASVHTHDHYHVSHHHKSGLAALGDDFEHRAYWHTHEHNHAELTHSHDYSQADEDQHHAKEAHIHDHGHPTETAG